MKVLDTPCEAPAFTTMAKKKHKLRKMSEVAQTDGSSEDISLAGTGCAGRGCIHSQKAVNLQTMRKGLRQSAFGRCVDCCAEGKNCGKSDDGEAARTSRPGADVVDGSSLDPEITIWLCLQCGHQGCDRTSNSKHALKHYQTPRSLSHSLVLNLTSWVVWCYECDDEVMDHSRRLSECADYIRRQISPPGQVQTTSPAPQGNVVRGSETVTDFTKVKVSSPTNNPPASGATVCNAPTLLRVKGLSNLGNTCFFNAVLQNLSQTRDLTDFVKDHIKPGTCIRLAPPVVATDSDSDAEVALDDDGDEHGHQTQSSLGSIDVVIPEAGSLTQSLTSFLKDMAVANKSHTISPSLLFGQICKKTPRFKGFQQQDSHELLRHLLDGMKCEEIKRIQLGILRYFNLPENVNPKNVDGNTKTRIREYGRSAKLHTFVDALFGGHLISTVVCEVCHAASQIHEPFLDLSLPLNEEKPGRPNAPASTNKERDRLMTEKNPDIAVVKKGVDGFIANSRKPSKHQIKKEKKLARSKKKRSRQKDPPLSGDVTVDNPAENDVTPDDSVNDDVKSTDDVKSAADDTSGQTQNDDDDSESTSDADVEDNIDTDTSRTAVTSSLVDSSVGCLGDDEDDVASDVNQMEQALPECDDPSVTRDDCDDNGVVECNLVTAGDVVTIATDDAGELATKLESLSLEESTEVNTEVTGEVSSEHSTPKHELITKSNRRELLNKSMSTLAQRYRPLAHECSLMSCLNQFTAAELLTGNNKFSCKNCTSSKWKSSGSQGKPESVYTNASKQLLICNPPAVLTLHLKRFQQVGYSLRKVNRHVDFPLILDLAPYCSALSKRVSPVHRAVKYALYGVVEHSGRLSGGHYTAHVRVRQHGGGVNRHFWQQTPFTGLHSNHQSPERHSPKQEQMLVADADDCTETRCATKGADCVPVVPAFSPGKWYYISDSHVKETSEHEVLKCQAYLLFYERIV